MMPAQVVLERQRATTGGLRSIKKLRTRAAIQDAALDLFADQGYDATTIEEIAARAEVGTTTFFAYFPTKSDVIVSDHSQWLPSFQQAIVDAAPSVTDIDAVRSAIRDRWLTAVDIDRTVRQAQAVATSHVLRGVSYDMGQEWLAATAGALARRHELDAPDDRCWLTARVTLTTLGHALQMWIVEGRSGDLAGRIDVGFRVLSDLRSE